MRTRFLSIGVALLLATPCAAGPVAPPRAGEMIYRSYHSPKGTLELLADAHPEGTTLHLKDIAVYPRGAKKIALGMRELFRLKNELTAEARGHGYTKLHITGLRLTGAKPGKTPDLWFDLGPACCATNDSSPTTQKSTPLEARRTSGE